jgi:hypothetical protein
MCNTATAYASFASTDVAAYEDLPGHHLLAVRNLIATTNDESYHGSANELPPATSHGYAEWDFSGVPDPEMFQRFLSHPILQRKPNASYMCARIIYTHMIDKTRVIPLL